MNVKDSEPHANFNTQGHFETVAASYKETRKPSQEVIDEIVKTAHYQHKKILDVGCGPGQVLKHLKEQYEVKGYGIDASPQMAITAQETSSLIIGRAEHLPFPSESFEGAISMMAVHLFERNQAFAEVSRVLQLGSIFTITSMDTNQLEQVWLQAFFPSYAVVEKRRLPSALQLEAELAKTGFREVKSVKYTLKNVNSRSTALAKLKSRAYSSFELISMVEYEQGVAKAERELPEQIEVNLPMIFTYATR